jgi:CheY-like chemotaxis protein
MFDTETTCDLNKLQSVRYLKGYTGSEVLEPLKSKRILIVDDDDILREFLDQVLRSFNFEVTSVNNAGLALDLLTKETFGLVLTDIQMPVMDGWELAENIKQISPGIPVIFMTGMDRSEVEKKIKNMDIDSILFKPFTFTLIKTTLDDYLAKVA